jgi:hypothetical protein
VAGDWFPQLRVTRDYGGFDVDGGAARVSSGPDSVPGTWQHMRSTESHPLGLWSAEVGRLRIGAEVFFRHGLTRPETRWNPCG